MKLTRGKLIETIRRKNEGWTSYQARKIAGVSVRRVSQLWRFYNQTGEIPEIGKKVGRPTKKVEEWEIKLVRDAYEKYRVSADTLERVIARDWQKHISHNKIHGILISLGYASKKNKKDIRKKKWIRYERKHSLTAVHIDWHQRPNDGPWAYAVIDDASRKMLSLIESESATTDYSIDGMNEALSYGKIKQCISDHGGQFVYNPGDSDSRFKEFLKSRGIKQILCRVKHPQSNGKVEKWFQIYEAHRDSFATKDEFMKWYNEIRPHRSLNFSVLETPEQAFIRKMRQED